MEKTLVLMATEKNLPASKDLCVYVSLFIYSR